MLCLSFAYGSGNVVPEDMVEAYKYLMLAEPYVEGGTLDMLETLKLEFDGQLTEEQLNESRKRADALRAAVDFVPK
jgi:hypothetical protein